MPTIQDIAKEIVAREGGFVNDPDDPGGATQFGVTLGTMRRLGLDLDGDGRVSVNDVKKLTRKDAEEIFISHYFETPGIGRLPAAVQASVLGRLPRAVPIRCSRWLRFILRMPMGLRVVIIITSWLIAGCPLANMQGERMEGRAVGSYVLKSSFPQNII